MVYLFSICVLLSLTSCISEIHGDERGLFDEVASVGRVNSALMPFPYRFSDIDYVRRIIEHNLSELKLNPEIPIDKQKPIYRTRFYKPKDSGEFVLGGELFSVEILPGGVLYRYAPELGLDGERQAFVSFDSLETVRDKNLGEYVPWTVRYWEDPSWNMYNKNADFIPIRAASEDYLQDFNPKFVENIAKDIFNEREDWWVVDIDVPKFEEGKIFDRLFDSMLDPDHPSSTVAEEFVASKESKFISNAALKSQLLNWKKRHGLDSHSEEIVAIRANVENLHLDHKIGRFALSGLEPSQMYRIDGYDIMSLTDRRYGLIPRVYEYNDWKRSFSVRQALDLSLLEPWVLGAQR